MHKKKLRILEKSTLLSKLFEIILGLWNESPDPS